jgi:UDP-glucose 4-epimerase
MEKILITGVAGGLGRLVARELRHHADIIGVDRAPAKQFPPGVAVHRVDLRKRALEDVIRSERPQVVLHLALLGSVDASGRRRGDRGVQATRELLGYCVEYGVKRIVALSTGLVYGAFAANPYRMDEGTPISGAANGNGIREWAEADALVSSFVWQFPEVDTCVLRPVPILGPTVRSTVGAYLRLPRIPTAMGFDPMVQFIAEEDVVRAVATTLDHSLRGIYNVTGPGEVPLSVAIRECQRVSWPIPSPLLRRALSALHARGLISFPAGWTDFLKYPVCLDGRLFESATGFQPKVDLPEIFHRMRR